MKDILIKTENIKLDQFLKWANIVKSGGEAKKIIQAGKVRVNGEVENKRSHKLNNGDTVVMVGTNNIYKVKKK